MSKLAYVVEDEENIRELIRAALSAAGYAVEGFEEAQALYGRLEAEVPAILLLDIMLPGQSGLDILRQLRGDGRYADLPVVFLTAKSDELDKVAGLDLGADDYIVKPFGVLELMARVNAVLRRYQKNEITQERHIYKDLVIDTASKTVSKGGVPLSLTFKEYELLCYLYQNRGIVLSREKLLEQIWNYDFEGETRTVDSHIRSLRSKIGDNRETPIYIQTNRGHGYRMLKE